MRQAHGSLYNMMSPHNALPLRLQGAEGSLCLTERGDVDPVVRHPDFRLFAAMNPPTDASKKDLPPALRRRWVL